MPTTNRFLGFAVAAAVVLVMLGLERAGLRVGFLGVALVAVPLVVLRDRSHRRGMEERARELGRWGAAQGFAVLPEPRPGSRWSPADGRDEVVAAIRVAEADPVVSARRLIWRTPLLTSEREGATVHVADVGEVIPSGRRQRSVHERTAVLVAHLPAGVTLPALVVTDGRAATSAVARLEGVAPTGDAAFDGRFSVTGTAALTDEARAFLLTQPPPVRIESRPGSLLWLHPVADVDAVGSLADRAVAAAQHLAVGSG